jgi:hypothetical protein
MSAEIDFEDSAQHLIIADFFERTEGEFVLVTSVLVDNLGYRCQIMPNSLSGVVAEAGALNPLEAERKAMARAIDEWNDVQEQLKAAAQALGLTEED